MNEAKLKSLATQFFGNSELPVHFYEAIKECVNEGYRMGFADGMVQAQLPDPFMEVQGG